MDFFLKQINPENDDPIKINLNSDEITIGRRSIVSLNKFYKVSRNHATFSKKNGAWYVRDLGSLNKLYVNFKEVQEQWVKVEIGDIIGFGAPNFNEKGSFVCVLTVKSRIKQEPFDTCDEYATSLNEKRQVTCPIMMNPIEESQAYNKKENHNHIRIKTEPPSSDYDVFQQGATATVTLEKVKTEHNQFTSCEASSTNVIHNKTGVSKEVGLSTLTSPNIVQLSRDNSINPATLKNPIKIEQNIHSYECIGSNKVFAPSGFSVNLPQTKVSTETLHNIKPISQNSNNSEKQSKLTTEVSEVGKVNFTCNEILEKLNKEFKNPNSLLNENIKKENNGSKQKLISSPSCHFENLETKKVTNRKTQRSYFEDPLIKECKVRLVKCDSKYFQWPSDLKNRYLSENMYAERVQFTSEKKYDTSFMSRTKLEQLQKNTDKPQRNAYKRKRWQRGKLKLNIYRNRILSSDSETSSEEYYLENASEEINFSSFISSESREIKADVEKRNKNRLKYELHHCTYEKSNPVSKVFSKTKDSTAKQMKKRAKLIETESDSSLSNSQCTILYPSIKTLKKKTAVRRSSNDSSDEDCISLSEDTLEPGYDFQTKYQSENNGYRERSVDNNKRKTVGRTLLTDPKPMKLQPKKMRGREEYFRKQHLLSKLKTVANVDCKYASQKDIANYLKMRKIPKRKESAPYPSKSYILQDIYSKNTYPKAHSRSKNGESRELDIVNNLNKTREIEYSLEKKPTPTIPKETRENEYTWLKKSTPAVPKRPNNYGSRMGFLVDVETKVENKKITSEKKTSRENLKNQTPTSVNVINTTENVSNSTFGLNDEMNSTETNLKRLQDNTVSLNQYPKPTFEAVYNNDISNALEIAKKKYEKNKENKMNPCPASLSRNSSLPSKSNLERESSTVESNSNTLLQEKIFSETSKGNKKIAIISPVKHSNTAEPSTCILYSTKQIDIPHVQDSILEKPAKLLQSTPDPNSNQEKTTNRSESTKDKNLKEIFSDSELKLHSRSLIENIVHWNPKWLEEQSKNKKPPPLVSKGGATIPLRFSSYNSYVKSFYPMLTLEIWESLFRESKPLWLKNETWNAFYYIIRSIHNRRGAMELNCESIVNENLSYHPSEGTVVLLDVKSAEQGINSCAFGYIHCHKSGNICNSEKLTEWAKVPEEWQRNAKLWTFSIYIKKSKKHGIDIGSVNLARGIINIKNKLQLVEALLAFKESPLQKDILNPSSEVFSFYESNSKIPREKLIQTVGDEISNENSKSKTILIDAPPGTGKTGAIIGIVEKLLFSSPCPIKIVLCAPTDKSVDEIGLRLVELNERYSWKGKCIRFVRFGQTDQINYKLQVYSLDTKVSRMFKEQNKKELLDRERELEILESKINDVLFREQQKNNKYRLRRINNDSLKDLMNQLKTLKEKSPLEYIDPVTQATYENIILKESHIILLTLDNCMHPLINKFFKSFTSELRACCIVDEATQSTEPEILQCLNRKVDRLVLVGDIKQLPPPVTSTYAIKWGFKRSLMERLLTLFSKQYNCILSPTMIEQYRMQTQICHFPSKYFYNDQLITNSVINERCLYSPLKPLIVYDILHKDTLNPSVNPDDSEPLIIAYICSQLLQVEPKASIGVIATSEYRAALYKVPLSHNEAFRDIEINVVEKYQGREKDIIILACIHPFHPIDDKNFLACEKKMNVAITRAQKCLIVCGHISSLSEYPHWHSFMTDAQSRKVSINVSSLQQIPITFMKTVCKNA